MRPPERPGLALVVLTAGRELGRILALDDGVQVIGRAATADLVLDVETISRRHARLTVDGARATVEDLGSSGGTWVNGERVDAGVGCALVSGDRLALGSTVLKVVAHGPPEPDLGCTRTDRDELTGTLHRKAILDALGAAIARDEPVAAVVCDIAQLGRINAAHGHAVGDEVLVGVATRLRGVLPPGAMLGRVSGGSLLAVLPGVDGDAEVEAERLRIAVAQAPVATREGPRPVGVRVGVVVCPRGAALDPKALAQAAAMKARR